MASGGSLASASPRPRVLTGWNEFDAAVHVLDDPLIAARTAPFVRDQPPAGIEFDRLLEACGAWSYGERLLVCAAVELWNGRGGEAAEQIGVHSVGLRRLADHLDEDRLRSVIDGLLILRGLAGG